MPGIKLTVPSDHKTMHQIEIHVETAEPVDGVLAGYVLDHAGAHGRRVEFNARAFFRVVGGAPRPRRRLAPCIAASRLAFVIIATLVTIDGTDQCLRTCQHRH